MFRNFDSALSQALSSEFSMFGESDRSLATAAARSLDGFSGSSCCRVNEILRSPNPTPEPGNWQEAGFWSVYR